MRQQGWQMCSGMANVSKVATDFLQWDIKLLWMMWVLCLPDESNVLIYSITTCLTEGWQWPLEVGETTLLCCKQAQRNICAVTTVQLQRKPLCFVHISCQFMPLSIVGTRTHRLVLTPSAIQRRLWNVALHPREWSRSPTWVEFRMHKHISLRQGDD